VLEQARTPLPWHEPLWAALAAQQQFAHAYLFCGRRVQASVISLQRSPAG